MTEENQKDLAEQIGAHTHPEAKPMQVNPEELQSIREPEEIQTDSIDIVAALKAKAEAVKEASPFKMQQVAGEAIEFAVNALADFVQDYSALVKRVEVLESRLSNQ